VMRAFCFLDQRGVNGVVSSCDVYEEGLMSVRLVEDRWEVRVVFNFWKICSQSSVHVNRVDFFKS